ncbi:bucentaur or craniofacial development-domain-containing protein [Sporodiniella umbellata]|nr:bucentaur or craniofacial development-domain-containing protein [Sporodiniella umbellata]
MTEKEYCLQDLYTDQTDDEEEQDSDFIPGDNDESGESAVEEESETEEEQTAKKRSFEKEREDKPEEDSTNKKARIDAIWKEMNETKQPVKESNIEAVKEETKEDSKQEAENKAQTKKKVNRPKSSLSSLVSQYNIKVPKMNTLEKSKLDWQKFVEKEGIKDELKYKNKDGYMEKVDFLQRVDERRLEQLKSGQKESKRK